MAATVRVRPSKAIESVPWWSVRQTTEPASRKRSMVADAGWP
jgi:hypothetical protein